MAAWWASLTLLQQIFAGIAIPATVILVLQTLLLLFGGGFGDHGDGDFDVDTDGDGIPDSHGGFGHGFGHGHDHDHDDVSGLRLFTVRGMVAFFAVGGWLGVVAAGTGIQAFWAVFFAFLGGLAAMLVVALFFKWMLGLQESGNTDYSSAVGSTAEVYITIPAKSNGRGKINVMLGSQLIEADAVTESESAIKPRTRVKVTGISEDNTYVVVPCE
ncbi:MAG: hypothetical protein IJL87_03325 [Clostridia bacterium]|nr:hypothetical protein [Clostridia bacterium]